MEKIHYQTWVHIKGRTNKIVIRVRWNNDLTSSTISTGCYAESGKWDSSTGRAKINTIHHCNGWILTAQQINVRIAEVLEEINSIFEDFSNKEIVPSSEDVKSELDKRHGAKLPPKQSAKPKKAAKKGKHNGKRPLRQLFLQFLSENERERNWRITVLPKYHQMWNHLTSCNENLTINKINKEYLLTVRQWFVDNKYRNSTTNKCFKYFRSFFKWLCEQGYTIDKEALKFKTNLKEPRKTVTYLSMEELDRFTNFDFGGGEHKKLGFVRDMWVFMANTSLRISDLKNLRYANVIEGNTIKLYTKKTTDEIIIPLTDDAKRIHEKYRDPDANPKSTVFCVPAEQNMNDDIKIAAQIAGLDRPISETYYIGNKRIDEVHPLHEIITNHMARRTFVVCSLSLGIPIEVVRKATGHSDFESMKPYINIANQAQVEEMAKWNRKPTPVQSVPQQPLSDILQTVDQEKLLQILQLMGLVNQNA